jgi:tRNA nucleotidyltransferase/poly(A) polymerase
VTRAARDVARCEQAELWLVGGYVRDTALERPASDVDLIAGRGVRRVVESLRRAWSTRGFRFRKRGVTTWRFGVEGRAVDLVDASRRGLKRDLLRRELTVNAIAFDLVAGELVDPLGGLADLRAKRLRLPHPGVMAEDPVRALRLARFHAELPEFRVDSLARERAARVARGLGRAPAERVRTELDKLLSAEAPARGLRLIEELGLLGAVLAELIPLGSCRAGAGRPDVWRHTLDAIERSSRPARLPGARAVRHPDDRRVIRWALLLHDISKPETLEIRADGRPTFHGHEVLGARRADALLERLRAPRDDRRRIGRLILNHLRPGHLADAGAPRRGMQRLVREAGDDLPLLVLHAACDALASGSPDGERRWRRLRRVLAELTTIHGTRRSAALPRLLDGRDLIRELGIESGPTIGVLLRGVRERQENGALTSRRQALAWARRQVRGRAKRT